MVVEELRLTLLLIETGAHLARLWLEQGTNAAEVQKFMDELVKLLSPPTKVVPLDKEN